MCDLFGIELRTGCHCNQGACSSYLGLTEQMLTEFREVNFLTFIIYLHFRWAKPVTMKSIWLMASLWALFEYHLGD